MCRIGKVAILIQFINQVLSERDQQEIASLERLFISEDTIGRCLGRNNAFKSPDNCS